MSGRLFSTPPLIFTPLPPKNQIATELRDTAAGVCGGCHFGRCVFYTALLTAALLAASLL